MYDAGAGTEAAPIDRAGASDIGAPATRAQGAPGRQELRIEPPAGQAVVAIDVRCADRWARVAIQTARPADDDDIEVRRALEMTPGPGGRWYPVRTVYPAEPMAHAPGAATFAYSADIPLDGTCDDLVSQLESVRATIDGNVATVRLGSAQ